MSRATDIGTDVCRLLKITPLFLSQAGTVLGAREAAKRKASFSQGETNNALFIGVTQSVFHLSQINKLLNGKQRHSKDTLITNFSG